MAAETDRSFVDVYPRPATEREAVDHGGRVAYLPLSEVDQGMITGRLGQTTQALPDADVQRDVGGSPSSPAVSRRANSSKRLNDSSGTTGASRPRDALISR